MRVLSLVCLALALVLGVQLFSAATPAVETVSGVVVDEAGGPLGGATVTLTTLQGAKRTTTTDAAGRFRFTDVPLGPVAIAVELVGFTTNTRRLHVERGTQTPLKIVLSVAPPHGGASQAAANAPTGQPMRAPAAAAAPAPIAGGVTGGIVGGVVGGLPAAPGAAGHASYRHRSAPWNTEAYDRIDDNAFRRAIDHPLSTFSIDVDTASYSNVRRFLNAGTLPPPDAVRSEELINYFKFDYPAPAPAAPFSITTEVAACPWNAKHKLALIGLQTPRIENGAAPPRNLVFLLDVSGSMMPPDKLPLVKTAMRMLVDTLTGKDKVAIVVYAGSSGLVLPATPGDRREEIHQAIERLEAGGSTNGAQGIQLAYDVASENFVPGGINRVILATDGDFNVGVTNQGDLIRLIEEKRERRVFLSVLGVGTGNLKDSTMEKLADKGNGNYAYLDSLHEARRVLVEEAGATLVTVAKDVKIQVEFNPSVVNAYRLIGYENRLLNKEDFNDDKKDAGEIGAGHSVTALYEVVPIGVDVNLPTVDPLKYQRPPSRPEHSPAAPASSAVAHPTHSASEGQPESGNSRGSSAELMNVKIRYKEPDGSASRRMQVPVANRATAASDRLGFAAAVAQFGMLLRKSEHKGAATWESTANLARRYRGADPEGYRAEFLRLIGLAGTLARQTETSARR